LSAVWSLVVAAACLLGLAVAPFAVPGRIEARVGARMPEFTLPAVPGGPTSGRFEADEVLGKKPLVVLFWATWCQPCRQELPLYQALYERYREQGLRVVAISMDGTNTLAQAGPMARRLGLTFPVVSDLDTAVTSRVNSRRAAPFSVWVDHEGRIVREREGFSMTEREEIARGVARLVRAANR
jgi:peroxiredoxin